MNLTELQDALVAAGVRERAYAIEGRSCLDEQYRLECRGGSWCTYYSERGLERNLVAFPSETAACSSFLRWVLNDPTTRRGSGRPDEER